MGTEGGGGKGYSRGIGCIYILGGERERAPSVRAFDCFFLYYT